MMKNKSYLLIGSNGKIGRALLNDLLEKNYSEIITVDIDNLKKHSNNHKHIKVDISKEKNLKKLFLNFEKSKNKVCNIINLTYPKNKNYGKDFLYLNEKDLKENLFLLLGTNILIAKYSIKYLLKNKIQGNILFTSSILGVNAPKFEHYSGLDMVSPIEYSAAKSGIIMLTKYLAKKYRKKNIRINCISPGGIKEKQNPIFYRRYKRDTGNKGMLDPIDIISTIDFLMDDKSKSINGQNIIIDDGWSL